MQSSLYSKLIDFFKKELEMPENKNRESEILKEYLKLIKDRIEAQHNVKFGGYNAFQYKNLHGLNKNKSIDTSKICSSTIDEFYNDTNTSVNKFISEIENDSDIEKIIKFLEGWLTRLEKIEKLFLHNENKEFLVYKDKNGINPLPDWLSNTLWEGYFFHVPQNKTSNNEDRCGFGKIAIYFGDDNKSLTFKNIPHNRDYDVCELEEIGKSLYEITCKVQSSDAFLRIWLYRNNKDNPEKANIIIGAFLSNFNDGIICCDIIFYKRNRTNEEEDLKKVETDYYTYNINREYFELENERENYIPKEIRIFLSKKYENYHRVKKGINTRDELKNFLDVKKSDSYPHKNNFINFEKPIIFMSTPTYSLKNKEYYEYFESKNNALIGYKKIFEAKYDFLNIIYRGNLKTKHSTVNDDEAKKVYSKTRNELERTTLFVLFYFKRVISNSLLELVIACNFAKRILIFSDSPNLDFFNEFYFLKNYEEKIKYSEISFDEFEKELSEINNYIKKTSQNKETEGTINSNKSKTNDDLKSIEEMKVNLKDASDKYLDFYGKLGIPLSVTRRVMRMSKEDAKKLFDNLKTIPEKYTEPNYIENIFYENNCRIEPNEARKIFDSKPLKINDNIFSDDNSIGNKYYQELDAFSKCFGRFEHKVIEIINQEILDLIEKGVL